MKLILFDMDQTLVNFITVQEKAVREIFVSFFNLPANLHDIDWDGKGMIETFHDLARFYNIPEERFLENRLQLKDAYINAFIRNFPPNASDYILPGAEELLSVLLKTDNILSLYTAASRQIVDTILNATGLVRFFRFCFFGAEMDNRSEMVKMAMEKAEESSGMVFRDGNIVIIGDSIRDIEAGRPFNALVISVATGYRSEETLRKAGADFVFKDLSRCESILKAIGSDK